MSAYLVTTGHIDALISFAALSTGAPLHLSPLVLTIPADAPCGDGAPIVIDSATQEGADTLGQVLFETNGMSLAARYGANDESALEGLALGESYTFQRHALKGIGPAEILGALKCFDYQACEHDGWQMSLGQWISAAIREKASRAFAKGYAIDANPDRIEADPTDAPEAPADDAPATVKGGLLAKLTAALTGDAGPDLTPAEPAAPDPAPVADVIPAGPKPDPTPAPRARKPRAPKPDAVTPKPEPETAAAKQNKAARTPRAGRSDSKAPAAPRPAANRRRAAPKA